MLKSELIAAGEPLNEKIHKWLRSGQKLEEPSVGMSRSVAPASAPLGYDANITYASASHANAGITNTGITNASNANGHTIPTSARLPSILSTIRLGLPVDNPMIVTAILLRLSLELYGKQKQITPSGRQEMLRSAEQ